MNIWCPDPDAMIEAISDLDAADKNQEHIRSQKPLDESEKD